MQRFAFRLQKVLDFQSQLRDIESRKLQALVGERTAVEQRILSLDEWVRREEDLMHNRKSLSGADLKQFAQFGQSARDRRGSLLQERAGLEARISAQRERVLLLDRKVEMMLRMKEARREEWVREASIEEERTATELFLAGRARSQAQPLRSKQAGTPAETD